MRRATDPAGWRRHRKAHRHLRVGRPRPAAVRWARRDDRSVGGLLFADGVEADPAQHTVVVGRKRLPGTSAPVREPHTVPRAHQRSAFDCGRGEVRAEMRACAGRHPQPSVGCAPGHDLDPAHGGAPGLGRDLRARREHEPVAARAALRTRDRRPDHRRIGVAVGGLLRRPVQRWKCLERPRFGCSLTQKCLE